MCRRVNRAFPARCGIRFPAKNPSSALFSGRGFFYPHLPAILKRNLPANRPEITRKTFLTYVRKE
ncbi:hypothetical protein EGJ48_22905 [Pantoea dispersa]|nr:hypothetical protein EGJ48_22905 [Pantoea dispersa]